MRAEGAAHKGGEWVSQSLTTTPFRIPSHSSPKLRSAFLVQSLSHDSVSGTAVGTCSTAASPEHSSRAAGGGGGFLPSHIPCCGLPAWVAGASGNAPQACPRCRGDVSGLHFLLRIPRRPAAAT